MPTTNQINMDTISLRTLWARAERDACIIFDSGGDPSDLLEVTRSLEASTNAMFRAYSFLWRGFFGKDGEALIRASILWQDLAGDNQSDAQDRGWLLHNAVVAELLYYGPTSGPSSDLLSRTLLALNTVDCEPSLAGDQTARRTFTLLRAEICFLAGKIQETCQIVEYLRSGVPFKSSLATELEGTALSVLQDQRGIAAAAYQEAARLHSLFMHKVRCRALANHLEFG